MTHRVLGPLDAFWLLAEQDRMPLHAAGLLEFTKPADAGPDFVARLRERMRGPWTPSSPWNLAPLTRASRVPVLREVGAIDVDAHVHLHGLPAGGGQRALGELVSDLHGRRLARDRPLWEMHLIDGLGEDQFAIYCKLHHSMIDGVSGMRRVISWLSTDPDARGGAPVFTVGPAAVGNPRSGHAPANGTLTGASTARGLAQLARFLSDSVRGELDGEPLAAPYRVPAGLFHGRITNERRIAHAQFSLTEVKEMARASGSTLNDVVLWLISSALRTYLAEHLELPETSLNAGCAVSLRGEDDERFGTAIGFLSVNLATNVADARDRLDTIRRSSNTGKRQLARLGREGLTLQVIVGQAPLAGGLLLRLGARTPAAYSVAVSNVPGPREQLYLEGARLDTLVPISIPLDNNPLNVTCVSHGDRLTFGITAAASTVPHVQRLATAMQEIWAEHRLTDPQPFSEEIDR